VTPLVAALLLPAPPLPLLVAALPPDTGVSASAEVRTVDLQWSGDVHLQLENNGYELVVRFDRPIADERLKDFASMAGDDLADLRWNDNSLLLRAAAGRRLEAVAEARKLRVRFVPESQSPAAPTVASPSPRPTWTSNSP